MMGETVRARKSMASGKTSMGSGKLRRDAGALAAAQYGIPDASMVNHDALEDGGRAMNKSAKFATNHARPAFVGGN